MGVKPGDEWQHRKSQRTWRVTGVTPLGVVLDGPGVNRPLAVTLDRLGTDWRTPPQKRPWEMTR